MNAVQVALTYLITLMLIIIGAIDVVTWLMKLWLRLTGRG